MQASAVFCPALSLHVCDPLASDEGAQSRINTNNADFVVTKITLVTTESVTCDDFG